MSATAVTTVPMNLAMFVQLGVGDYLVAEALQSSGAALNLDASSTFWLRLG